MTDTKTSTWPPSGGLTSPSVPTSDVILTSYGSTRIKAPASLVFETVRDLGKYHEWNTFAPETKVLSQPEGQKDGDMMLNVGMSFTFHVIMDAKKPNSKTQIQLRITDISTPSNPSTYIPSSTLESEPTYTADLSDVYRISWKAEGGFANRGLRTERFHEIIVLGDNECEVRTWENQGGVLAHTVKWFYKKVLMEKFQLWCNDLKGYCEKKASG